MLNVWSFLMEVHEKTKVLHQVIFVVAIQMSDFWNN